MAVPLNDYESLLYKIQNPNREVAVIELPEKLYHIDLDSRIIETPQYLSVKHDHNAETIYFTVDRYYDHTDLARSDISIVIQYENANPDKRQRGYIYAPPFIDVTTLEDEQKIIIPWVIEGPATEYSGKVTFAVKFYRLNSLGFYEYNLNTLPSTSEVQYGMNVYKTTDNYVTLPNELEKIYARIDEIAKTNDLYWITIE